ncbi:uncharacterized protein LOC135823265 [Sycon ciliatum]|uniref:uncharacterized protein LOC135823265 n=1 Tax=Sycon ciliatum TaxID=27933 RepID=UPI0031F6CA12
MDQTSIQQFAARQVSVLTCKATGTNATRVLPGKGRRHGAQGRPALQDITNFETITKTKLLEPVKPSGSRVVPESVKACFEDIAPDKPGDNDKTVSKANPSTSCEVMPSSLHDLLPPDGDLGESSAILTKPEAAVPSEAPRACCSVSPVEENAADTSSNCMSFTTEAIVDGSTCDVEIDMPSDVESPDQQMKSDDTFQDSSWEADTDQDWMDMFSDIDMSDCSSVLLADDEVKDDAAQGCTRHDARDKGKGPEAATSDLNPLCAGGEKRKDVRNDQAGKGAPPNDDRDSVTRGAEIDMPSDVESPDQQMKSDDTFQDSSWEADTDQDWMDMFSDIDMSDCSSVLLADDEVKDDAAQGCTRHDARDKGKGPEAATSDLNPLCAGGEKRKDERNDQAGKGAPPNDDRDSVTRAHSVKYVPENPQMCLEYYDQILTNMRTAESKPEYVLSRKFLKRTDVSMMMRAFLINWLVKVHYRYGLLQETLFKTVQLLDAVLDKMPVTGRNLQLAGVTSMLVASKYEEVQTPEVADFAYITDYGCSSDDIIKFERSQLAALDMSIMRPFSLQFLRMFSYGTDSSSAEHCVAKYFTELAILCPTAARWRPSYVAASSLFLAKWLLQGASEGEGQSRLCDYTLYSTLELMEGSTDLAWLLHNVQCSAGKLDAIPEKYSKSPFNAVSAWETVHGPLFQSIVRMSGQSTRWKFP